MEEGYNSKEKYFGAKGTITYDLAQKSLDYVYIPHRLKESFYEAVNKGAYDHDISYKGKRRSGLLGWLLDELERWRGDRALKKAITSWLRSNKKGMNSLAIESVEDFSKLTYIAVRVGGLIFFRTD